MNAFQYLESLAHFGQKLGLETTDALCDVLGRPERAYATLLVAGTNGKGSVAAYLDSALRASGCRVGRYTSPHLVRVNERIVVGGRDITDDELTEDLGRVREASDALLAAGRLSAPPTYFEALTVAAFLRFRTRSVGVAVLEVGMGGRLDATNVADPLASAIVSIDFDHEAYLGRTLTAIAREKAGVLRPGRAAVLGPMAAEARDAIEGTSRAVGARLVDSRSGSTWREERDGLALRTPRHEYRCLRPLPGAHQRDNVLVALRLLEESGIAERNPAAVAAGISATRWPGRLQWIPGDVPLLLDGAHNPAGARALGEHLLDVGPFVLLFGALKDKAVSSMAEILFPLAREIVITQPPAARAAPAADLLAIDAGRAPRHAVPDVREALALARQKARGVGPVVVAGSLYLVGAVLESLDEPPSA